MKFGHRVYATEDPRGIHLRGTSAGHAGTRGDDTSFWMSRRIGEDAHAAPDIQACAVRGRVPGPAPRHAALLVTAR